MSAQVLHGGKVYLIEFVRQLNVFHYLIQPPYCSSIQTIIMIIFYFQIIEFKKNEKNFKQNAVITYQKLIG